MYGCPTTDTAQNFLALAGSGYYDACLIHRCDAVWSVGSMVMMGSCR
jgi:cyclophilin family peptidyl-prolyl cis-trans isomerase